MSESFIRKLVLRLEEGGESFDLMPIKDGVRYFDRNDVLLCRCDRPLVLQAPYSRTGIDEGSMLCALADRYQSGSLLATGRLPAMVNVLVLRPPISSDASELKETQAIFAYTGVLSEAVRC